jgi:peptidoglycan/xylan/chitin deacetylase (PgdA/CDA1 family)
VCILTGHRAVEEAALPHDARRATLRSFLDRWQSSVRFSTDLLSGAGDTATFALTFDDGSGDHAWVGRFLAERGLRGVFFLTTGLLETPGFLTWEQARELVALGHEVGSHGADHLAVRRLTAAELRVQVHDSKARLEDELQAPVRYFAPPFGYGAPGLSAALAAAGYRGCRLTRWGLYRPDRGSPWRLPSIPLTDFTVTAGWLDRIFSQGRVPVAMRATWLGRAVLPEPLRIVARRALRASAHDRPTSG